MNTFRTLVSAFVELRRWWDQHNLPRGEFRITIHVKDVATKFHVEDCLAMDARHEDPTLTVGFCRDRSQVITNIMGVPIEIVSDQKYAGPVKIVRGTDLPAFLLRQVD